MFRAIKMESLSDAAHTVYKVAAWFISVNHRSRRVQMTSGDYWFPISRAEAARWLFNTRTAP